MKEECFVFAENDKDSVSGMKIFLVPKRWEFYPDDAAVKLCKVEVEYFIPSDMTMEDIRRRAIETLKDKQIRVIAEAERRKNQLQAKIDNLLLLTHNPI